LHDGARWRALCRARRLTENDDHAAWLVATKVGVPLESVTVRAGREVVEDFRRARGERDDPRAVDLLGLLGLLMYGWIFGLCAVIHTDPAERRWAREELAWWVPRARRTLETWSP
jgi:hypothetical protein